MAKHFFFLVNYLHGRNIFDTETVFSNVSVIVEMSFMMPF